MVNSVRYLAIDEVSSPAERGHYLAQECVTAGLAATFVTYFAGIVAIPFMLKTVQRIIPIPFEYRVASGALLSVGAAYFVGIHAKKKCEEDIKRQLDEKLGV